AGEAAVAPPRAAGGAAFAPMVAGEEGDDAVALLEVRDLQEQGLVVEQPHRHGVAAMLARGRRNSRRVRGFLASLPWMSERAMVDCRAARDESEAAAVSTCAIP